MIAPASNFIHQRWIMKCFKPPTLYIHTVRCKAVERQMTSRTTYILTSLLLLTAISCDKKTSNEDKVPFETEDAVSMNQITTNYDTLIRNVTIKGDTNAYDELFYGFVDANKIERTDSVLRYSKIMATDFHYERAYWDYLRALCEKNQIEFDELYNLDLTKSEEKSKKTIVEWLDKMLANKIITKEEFDTVEK
jgi:hypothetical protein